MAKNLQMICFAYRRDYKLSEEKDVHHIYIKTFDKQNDSFTRGKPD